MGAVNPFQKLVHQEPWVFHASYLVIKNHTTWHEATSIINLANYIKRKIHDYEKHITHRKANEQTKQKNSRIILKAQQK